METVVEQLFSILCHQMPARSPVLATGEPYLLCFRCTGCYWGAFIAACVCFVNRRHTSLYSRDAFILAALCGPYWIDGWLNTLHILDSPSYVRYMSGYFCGFCGSCLGVRLLMLKHHLFRSKNQNGWTAPGLILIAVLAFIQIYALERCGEIVVQCFILCSLLGVMVVATILVLGVIPLIAQGCRSVIAA